jgi:hypothetical protein
MTKYILNYSYDDGTSDSEYCFDEYDAHERYDELISEPGVEWVKLESVTVYGGMMCDSEVIKEYDICYA